MSAGLDVVLNYVPDFLVYLRVIGSAYLLYLAYRIFNISSLGEVAEVDAPLGFLHGAAFQWVNPKSWIVAISAVSSFSFLSDSQVVNGLVLSAVFSIDIHPAAQIDEGLMIDHGTGVVIGETAIIGKDVSLMQGVTLGGTGKDSHDRHPIIRDNVLVSSGAKVLGRIEIGSGAKIGAGSVVLEDIPAHSTAVGVPATVVGQPRSKTPSLEMDHTMKGDQKRRGQSGTLTRR